MVIKAKVFCPNCRNDTFIIHADTEGGLNVRCAVCEETLGFSKSYYISDTEETTLPDDETIGDDDTTGDDDITGD